MNTKSRKVVYSSRLYDRLADQFKSNLIVGMESESTIVSLPRFYCESYSMFLGDHRSTCGKHCTSCRGRLAITTDPELARRHLAQTLGPTGHHYTLGTHGIKDIKGDASVPQGVEVISAGLPFIPELMHRVYTDVCHQLTICGGTTNQYTGLHFHIMQQGDKSVFNNIPFPPYYLYNVMFLSSIVAPLLCFHSLALMDYTRYSIFRSPYFLNTVLDNSCLLREIKRQPPVGDRREKLGKYLLVTPYLSQFNGKKELIRPHVEFRHADNILDANYYVLNALLCGAIMLKAMNLSPNEYYDVQANELTVAQKLTVKMINTGIGIRKGIITLTEKDVVEMKKLRSIIISELKDELLQLDPYGNIIEMCENIGKGQVAYRSTDKMVGRVFLDAPV